MQKPDPSSIPLSPGVYLYRDGKGQVIYVGKARILRRRVLSYFRPEGLPAKTKARASLWPTKPRPCWPTRRASNS